MKPAAACSDRPSSTLASATFISSFASSKCRSRSSSLFGSCKRNRSRARLIAARASAPDPPASSNALVSAACAAARSSSRAVRSGGRTSTSGSTSSASSSRTRMNSLSSGRLGLRPAENGKLLSLMTRSSEGDRITTSSMVTKGNLKVSPRPKSPGRGKGAEVESRWGRRCRGGPAPRPCSRSPRNRSSIDRS